MIGLIGMFDRCVYGPALVRSSVDIGQQEFVEVGIDADCDRTNKKQVCVALPLRNLGRL